MDTEKIRSLTDRRDQLKRAGANIYYSETGSCVYLVFSQTIEDSGEGLCDKLRNAINGAFRLIVEQEVTKIEAETQTRRSLTCAIR